MGAETNGAKSRIVLCVVSGVHLMACLVKILGRASEPTLSRCSLEAHRDLLHARGADTLQFLEPCGPERWFGRTSIDTLGGSRVQT